MKVFVAASNVDNEDHLRFYSNDVGEILLGSDSHVDTARFRGLDQIGDDVLEVQLIREQVVRSKGSILFRNFDGHAPEDKVGKSLRNGLSPDSNNNSDYEGEESSNKN